MTLALFLDVETTGLRSTDPILEIALILGDIDRWYLFNEISRFESVIEPPVTSYLNTGSMDLRDHRLRVYFDHLHPVVYAMHMDNGLIAEILANPQPTITDVDTAIGAWLGRHVNWDATPKLHAAGSGVAQFDLRVIAEQLPGLSRKLHYRSYDVSPMTEILRDWCGLGMSRRADPPPHRAMDDALDSLRVMRETVEGIRRLDWLRSHHDCKEDE